MSGQGTGSIHRYSFEVQLLDAWGTWARGDIGLGYGSSGVWGNNGLGSFFTDYELCQADAAIACLPKAHKSTLKKWFITRKGYQIDEHRKQSAVQAFAESIAGANEE